MDKKMIVSVKNYGVVKKADIEFVSGLNIISGESGTGKSTILRGIEGAVFNSSGDEVITQGENKAEITIKYNNHIVTRTRDKKGSFKTNYIVDGDVISKVGSTPVKSVLDCFGIKEIKTGSNAIRPNFLSQFSAPFLVNEQPSKIFEYLTITSKAVSLKDVESSITEDLNNAKQDKKIKEEVSASLKKMVLETQKILENEELVLQLEKSVNKLNNKSERIELLQTIINNIESTSEKANYYSKEINVLENRLEKINKSGFDFNKMHDMITKIEKLDKAVYNYNQLLCNHNATEKRLEGLERVKEKTNVLNTIENKVLKIKNISDIINEISDRIDKTNKLKEEGSLASNNNKALKEQINNFKQQNIPVIVITTNEELENNLQITRGDTIKILTEHSNV